MRKPTREEINEFSKRIGMVLDEYAGVVTFKFILNEYCNNIVDEKPRPMMMDLYGKASEYSLENNCGYSKDSKTASGSERNLRCAIERVWREPHSGTLDSIFMYYRSMKRPSNTVFIASCAHYLLEEIEAKDKTEVKDFETRYMLAKLEAEVSKKMEDTYEYEDIPERVKSFIDKRLHEIVSESLKASCL